MTPSWKRALLIVLGGVWCAVIVFRILMTEPPQEVPLTFVSRRPAPKSQHPAGTADSWQVTHVTVQARTIAETPKKNIFAPLGESTAVGTSVKEGLPIAARHAKRTVQAPPPIVVVAAPPPPPPAPPPLPLSPPTPSPEEVAEQQARLQKELRIKQLREQMGQYRYLGYLNQQGVQKAFVGKGKDIYIIRKGDTLDGTFLVASIDSSIVKLREPSTSLETSLEIKKDGGHGPL